MINEFKLSDYRQYSTVFIETGTNIGAMVEQAIACDFVDIRSVELDETLAKQAAKKFQGNPRVTLWQGRSDLLLPEMLRGLTMPAVILLDAHPSGPGTAGHDDFIAHGNARESAFHQHNILLRELLVICQHPVHHHILIDDQHGFNDDNLLYRNMLMAVNPSYQFSFTGPADCPDKMLVCHPNP